MSGRGCGFLFGYELVMTHIRRWCLVKMRLFFIVSQTVSFFAHTSVGGFETGVVSQVFLFLLFNGIPASAY